MPLDFDKALDEANAYYAAEKMRKSGIPQKDWAYMAPEMFPSIQSDQAKAILYALVNAINSQSNGTT